MIQKETCSQNSSDAESLIIDGIYKDIFRGTLDHRRQCFQVEASTPRDTKDEQIDSFMTVLDAWNARLQTLDASLVTQLEMLKRSEDEALLMQKKKQEQKKKKDQQETQDSTDTQFILSDSQL